ncbi:MAG: hypothetical protein LUF04_11635 [Bacteroides sp.]|nr:hypothetical protein [Bacteroides sp.]
MKHTCYCLTLLCLVFSATLHALPWQRKVIRYERNQYGAGWQNWMIAPAPQGRVCFANAGGLLVWDGAGWELCPVRQGLTVYSVRSVADRIYIGCRNEFGFFAPDPQGVLTYHSLSLNAARWGGIVWNILELGSEICFVSDGHIHLYDPRADRLRAVPVAAKVNCSAVLGQHLYLGTDQGVWWLNDREQVVPWERDTLPADRKVISLFEVGEQQYVVTAKSGLYVADQQGLRPFPVSCEDFVRDNQMFCAASSGSLVALGSVQEGVLLIDVDDPGRCERFALEQGLGNNTVLGLSFDASGNLWLGLDKGIGYIDLQASLRPLFPVVSPISTGYCSAFYRGEWYLGTNQGVYCWRQGEFRLIKGSGGQTWSLRGIGDELFACGDNGILVITPSGSYRVHSAGVWDIAPLKADRNRLIVSAYSSFYILARKGDRWQFSHRTESYYGSTHGSVEADESYSFWIVRSAGEIHRVTFDLRFDTLLNRRIYPFDPGTFGQNTRLCRLENDLIACARTGIYRYVKVNDSWERFPQLEEKLLGARYYEYMDVDAEQNIWFMAGQELYLLRRQQEGYAPRPVKIGLSDELAANQVSVTLADPQMAVIAVDNGFARIDPGQLAPDRESAPVYIRKVVSIDTDSLLCQGVPDSAPIWPYSMNSVRIGFASPDPSSSRVYYSYRLRGMDEQWSPPSLHTSKDYTHLPEGSYVFEVKRSDAGDGAEIAAFPFVVRPPWFRTLWARLLYAAFILVGLYLFYRRAISGRQRIIEQKQVEIRRQKELHLAESRVKDQAIVALQNENLRAELRHKTQELTGYMLNVKRKNEILEGVRQQVLALADDLQQADQAGLRDKIRRLCREIDKNRVDDRDFEVFYSRFDFIHRAFFALLGERYPALTRNEKMLCAYLKMNLTTKEIASLLNLSFRSVEVNRYRLRKKMNLDKGVNLNEFLQQLDAQAGGSGLSEEEIAVLFPSPEIQPDELREGDLSEDPTQ